MLDGRPNIFAILHRYTMCTTVSSGHIIRRTTINGYAPQSLSPPPDKRYWHQSLNALNIFLCNNNNTTIFPDILNFSKWTCVTRLMSNKTTAATPLVFFLFSVLLENVLFSFFYGRSALNAHLLHFLFVRLTCFFLLFPHFFYFAFFLFTHLNKQNHPTRIAYPNFQSDDFDVKEWVLDDVSIMVNWIWSWLWMVWMPWSWGKLKQKNLRVIGSWVHEYEHVIASRLKGSAANVLLGLRMRFYFWNSVLTENGDWNWPSGGGEQGGEN